MIRLRVSKVNQPIPSNLSFNNNRVFTAIFNWNFFNGLSYICNKDAKKLKNIVKYILQKILGLNNYLYLFARFMIVKLPWDKNEKDFLKFLDLLNDSGHVLDIGANIGVMTYHFAHKLKNTQVHSFEPIPVNLNILKRVVKKYKLSNVKIYPFALGESNGNVQMVMPESNKVYFHGLSHINDNEKNSKGLICNVEMKRLDDLEELKELKIKAIKLDVEDFEYQVLKGGENLIVKNKPIIYAELWDSENKRKSFDLLKKLNYKSFINSKKHLEEYKDQLGFQNYFFIPSEYCDDLKL